MIWFNELKQKEMKTRGVTGHSDNFNEGLQFKVFLKKVQRQSKKKKKSIQNFDSLNPISICILYRKAIEKIQ